MSLYIKEIVFGKEIDKFINFPHDLYANDPNYTPEIFIGQKDMMNPKKFPFHKYGKVKYYLAFDQDKIVGRIAAISNPNYNAHHGSNVGFFGFFDTIEDQNVVNALMKKAEEFARENGYEALLGPTNFSTNETAGVLVEGFHEPAKVMMTYNAPYYGQVLEKNGFEKEMDLYAYMIKTDEVSEKSLKLSALIEERLKKRGITIRNVSKKNLDEEAKKIKKVYNAAWDNNWGFVPFTDDEFEYLKNDLKMILNEKFAYIAEKDGEPIGFSITLPNINEILIKNKRGKLFPFGIFRLLFGQKNIKYVRILALGVLEEYRKAGIEALFFAKNIQQAKHDGLIGGEASWILENNESMRAAAERLNSTKYKTYRLYRKNLD